ncbi:centromere protein F-like [Watersipora subatra]|uniref:centromere protein F-like n=1 Tax=Watersipora subatra TaxID=2589382 RepID=UPI00355C05A3
MYHTSYASVLSKTALSYDSESPPEFISAANSLALSELNVNTRRLKSVDAELSRAPESAPNLPHISEGDSLTTGKKHSAHAVKTQKEKEMAQLKNELKLKPVEKQSDDVVEEAAIEDGSPAVVTDQPIPPIKSQQHMMPVPAQEKASVPELHISQPGEKLTKRVEELEQVVATLSNSTVTLLKKQSGEGEAAQDIETRLLMMETNMAEMIKAVGAIQDDLSITHQQIDSLYNDKKQIKKLEETLRAEKEINEGRASNDEGMIQEHPSPTDKPFLNTDKPVTPDSDKPVTPDSDKPVVPASDKPVVPASDKPVIPVSDKPVKEATKSSKAIREKMAAEKRRTSEINRLISDHLKQLNNKLDSFVTWDDLERHLTTQQSGLLISSSSHIPLTESAGAAPASRANERISINRTHALDPTTAHSADSDSDQQEQFRYDEETSENSSKKLINGYDEASKGKTTYKGTRLEYNERESTTDIQLQEKELDRGEAKKKYIEKEGIFVEDITSAVHTEDTEQLHDWQGGSELNFSATWSGGSRDGTRKSSRKNNSQQMEITETFEQGNDKMGKTQWVQQPQIGTTEDTSRRYRQQSSIQGVPSSDAEYEGRKDGPSYHLQKTLESLSDTPNRQQVLSKVVDNINRSKAEKLLLERAEQRNDERFDRVEEKVGRHDSELTAFREIVQHVSSQKVDRDYLKFALSMKSDKRDIAELVDMKYFKRTNKILEDSINGLRFKVKNLEQEFNWRETIDKVLSKMNSKAEQEEVLSIKKILQNFEAKLQKLMMTDYRLHADDATAFKKQMMPFNCLACNKNVSLDPNKISVNLPMEGGISGHKSHRPYTSYELKSIREQLQNRDDIYDPFSAPRPVGGNYTMIDPLRQQRNARNIAIHEEILNGKASPLPTGGPSQQSINVHNHIVFGHDGKIYKGNQSSKLPKVTDRNKAPPPTHSPTPEPPSIRSL